MLVTGGSRGIGLAVVRECLALGANVAIAARDQQRLEWVVNDLAEQHPNQQVRALAVDLGYAESINRVGGWLAEEWSSLHVLVNNVGVNVRKPALDYLPDEYLRVLETNLTGVFELTRQLHPLLAAAAGASVVSVASVAGLTHIGTGTPYAMSKAGLIQMTRSLACEWAADAVRVNIVAPWYVATDLVKPLLDDPEYLADVRATTPLGRVGEPAEIARCVAFLALPASSYVTGQCLSADGGFGAFGFAGPVGRG